MEQRKSTSKRDILIVAIVAIVAIFAILFRSAFAQKGAYALVHIVGEESLEIPLQKDQIYTIENANLPVTLEVKDGAIRFVDSQCPDLLCEGYGFIQNEGERATCMPAGVDVTIYQD